MNYFTLYFAFQSQICVPHSPKSPSSLQCPVLVAWGDKDPWEPIKLGRAYEKFDSVEDFIVLPNVGHCPQVCVCVYVL